MSNKNEDARIFNYLLKDAIRDEKEGVDYACSHHDRVLLNEMFKEINSSFNININYLAEMDKFYIKGSSEIIVKYLPKFSSHMVKACLSPQLVNDKIENCDTILLDLYLSFKNSNEYINEKTQLSPSYICVVHDNNFLKLKPKKIKQDLLRLIYDPIDRSNLPLTAQMLASWRLPELEDLFISHLQEFVSTGIIEYDEKTHPLTFAQRQNIFTSINALKYFPSYQATEILTKYAKSFDENIAEAAEKTLKYYLKNKHEI